MWFWLLLLYCSITLVCIIFNFSKNGLLPHEWKYIKKYNLFRKIIFTFPFWLSIVIFYILAYTALLFVNVVTYIYIER
jgi:hypothetical protein